MTFESSEKEKEYFAKLELERKKKIEENQRKRVTQEEKERLAKLHYMCCPKCGTSLIEVNYKGIAIDQCANCHGVWLDSGELQQIIELSRPAFDKLLKIFLTR